MSSASLAAAIVWFVAFYPNFASLPVPTPLSQIHLGCCRPGTGRFQFGVNLDEPNRDPINWMSVAILTIAVTGLCVAVIYAVRSRRETGARVVLAGHGSDGLPVDGCRRRRQRECLRLLARLARTNRSAAARAVRRRAPDWCAAAGGPARRRAAPRRGSTPRPWR